ncbi:MAG: hypothetical protein IT442_11935 [Phycisphaeraceae bacterium]|nr:hypothetical protein [Phycisphaeraceae bacterium]
MAMGMLGDEALFESGGFRVRAGEMKLRHAVAEMPGGDGGRVEALGREVREIEQEGELRADTLVELRGLISAIEERVDGVERELVDELGERWPGVVLVGFEAREPVRLGPRWKVDYRAKYVQVRP